MAVAYQSAQTNNGTTTTITVTKPVSLAIGDLMLGAIQDVTNGQSLPSGWTQVRNIGANSGLIVFWKIATSGDVAATNFTFTGSNGFNKIGSIARFTGTHQTAPVDQSNFVATNTNAATITSSGITPTAANSMFVMVAGCYNGLGTALSVSGYAVVTDNPTWTEAFDINNGASGDRTQLSYAYGSRAQTTACGNATINPSPNAGGNLVILNIIPPTPPANSAFLGFM